MAKNMYQKREERKSKKMNDDGKSFSNVSINWYPGHMAKTKKQIIEDLKLIDVVIEILDARIPKSSKNPDMEQYIKEKNRIIVLNKSDLADPNATKKWIQYFENKGIQAIEMEASKGKGVKSIVPLIERAYKENSEKYIRKGRIGRTIKVMILGIPNVGKSTFINSISNKSSARVANRPGVTTQKQWISLGENIELMDTPGMLWPKLNDEGVAMNLAFVNTIGHTAIDNEQISYELLKYLIQNYKSRIEERYEIKLNEDEKDEEIDETLKIRNQIAIKKGCILPGNKINEQKVSDMIINDFQSGKLGKITLEIPNKN